jgi:hypothetical protein
MFFFWDLHCFQFFINWIVAFAFHSLFRLGFLNVINVQLITLLEYTDFFFFFIQFQSIDDLIVNFYFTKLLQSEWLVVSLLNLVKWNRELIIINDLWIYDNMNLNNIFTWTLIYKRVVLVCQIVTLWGIDGDV